MNQSKSYSWAAIVAGILFVLIALLSLVGNISLTVIGLSLGYLIIAIALFIRKRNALIVVGCIITTIVTVIITCSSIVMIMRYYGFNIYNLVNSVLNLTNIAGVIVFTVIAANSKSAEKRLKLKNVWFLPAILIIISDVMTLVIQLVFGWRMGYGIVSPVSLLGYAIVFLAFLFAGMWLCLGSDKAAVNPAINYAAAAAPAYAPPAQAPASVPEELKIYIDLVNSGAITVEEYEAKRKQLLGQ